MYILANKNITSDKLVRGKYTVYVVHRDWKHSPSLAKAFNKLIDEAKFDMKWRKKDFSMIKLSCKIFWPSSSSIILLGHFVFISVLWLICVSQSQKEQGHIVYPPCPRSMDIIFKSSRKVHAWSLYFKNYSWILITFFKIYRRPNCDGCAISRIVYWSKTLHPILNFLLNNIRTYINFLIFTINQNSFCDKTVHCIFLTIIF